MQLKVLRQRKRLSVRDLAAKTGMSYTYLSNIENGKANPSLNTLSRLATVLGVSVATLLKDPTPPTRRP
jgi:transcriptional regulator with XRE-family HTH domain